MPPVTRPEGHMSLNYIPTTQSMSGTSTGRNSPNDPSAAAPIKPPFGSSTSLNGAAGSIGSARLGAGSPSHELGARLFSKRAREIQAEEGVSPSIWGPPTSGHSTPLRENIPESPSQEGFPDLVPPSSSSMNSPGRRTRAGTVPSRFPPVGVLNETNLQQPFMAQSSRPTPSTSPFRPTGVSGIDTGVKPATTMGGGGTGSLSRLRAGSMPQRASFLGSAGPFGPSLFSTSWASGRDRATTLTSIRSGDGPASPTQSSYSRDGLTDTDVKTLDYLGLAETPQQARANLVRPPVDVLLQQQQQQQTSSLPPLLAELAMIKNNSRIRSYSVNAKEKYADDEELEYESRYSQLPSGTLTPNAAATAAQLAATQAQIHQHNLAVQAFASHATVNRPRARTAGILEAPPQRSSIRNYLATPSRLENSFSAADLNIAETAEYDELAEAVQLMNLGGNPGAGMNLRPTAELVDENNQDGPTRALWIGSIPVSTTVTSLEAIFSMYGKIESTRVLTHKNCGFVNFERIESAIQAKSLLNGKEIFPGAGPVRIGYAKVPGSSNAGTPGVNGAQQSPTPDPNAKSSAPDADKFNSGTTVPRIPALSDLQPELVQIVNEFGATDDEVLKITSSIQQAIAYQVFHDEIPSVPEPNQTRMFDAPRLRDIRKRIDNGACSVQEIEETAVSMLPEIAELSSDYLGNTVVQKLFEFCSEPTKEQMLGPIAPHLGEIGVHKNGTWAAQKIIDVAKTPRQMQMIVDALRPYTVPLFLDQYGNYVLQCCLRFGSPYNDFVFESMLSRMWEIAQGRFGARAMRACLESHHATKDQQRMLAAAIALHSVQLATNANGALLLTWFLDTCTFPRRRTVLAPRLVPHLVHLCTHKVAYLTVLKVINQRNEPEAREIVLKALFFSPGDEVLEKILSDQTSGATLIFKVLTTPFFDESMRAEVVKTVSKVLTILKPVPNQGYKRLMDEVGLSSRGGSRDNHHGRETGGHSTNAEKQQHRPASRQAAANYPSQPPLERQYSGQFSPMGQNLDGARPISSDHQNTTGQFEPYSVNAVGGLATSSSMNNLNGIGGMNGSGFGQEPMMPLAQQQLQYQAYLAAQSRGVSPGGLYTGMGNTPYGYPTGTDNLRAMQAQPAPLSGAPNQLNPGPMLNQSPYAPQQFSPVMGASQMYQYPPQFYAQTPPVQGQPAGGRRGRR
ncbi:Putative RNA binding protein Jsn1 [Aspergillus calidoustus]|uniref:Putative RNA binding protein Jsn1 n=1 Tax=Aspergillus calidoustus TaxID=454130 RepID=A0A0U5G152_ASPCI|nr:Putative RNA binding protein Jsn1 [Aspergillus calidoustus]